MKTYTIEKSVQWHGHSSKKSATVCRMFGLTSEKLMQKKITHKCTLAIEDGDIVYITGPSGAGKSLLLKELQRYIKPADRINLSQIALADDKAVIDCISGNIINSIKTLSLAGLNDVFTILNKPSQLSDGEKWRFRLAMALDAKKKYIVADEFCSNLDRITASVIAYNIKKLTNQTGKIFLLASSHEDMLLELSPDILVTKELNGETKVIYKNSLRQKN